MLEAASLPIHGNSPALVFKSELCPFHALAAPVAETGYAKRGWIPLFVFFVIILLRGLAGTAAGGSLFSSGLQNLTGLTWSQIGTQYPGLATFINGSLVEGNLYTIGFAIAGLVISYTSYRKGEMWAWYVSWYAVVLLLGFFYLVLTNAEGGGNYPANSGLLTLESIFMILVLLGLFLPYRKFFPKKQSA
jgi:hypothetical protein